MEMKSKNALELNYAEEFRVACTVNNLRYEEVLQHFIDSVSFYVFIGGEIDAASQWATQVMVECRDNFDSKPVMVDNEELRRTCIKYVELLMELSNSTHLSAKAKVRKSYSVMQSWSQALAEQAEYQQQVEVNSNYELSISFDFNLLCLMTGICAEQALQYFIDTVSLAEDRALNLYEVIKINPGTAFTLLLLVRDSATKNIRLPQEHIFIKHGLKLLDLDELLEEENYFEYRVKAYRKLYLEWYNALRVIVN